MINLLNSFLYYYSIFSAQEVILAKLIYNILLMLLMSLVAYAFFIVLIGNPAMAVGKFILVILLGGTSLSVLFTLLSAIAGKAGGNSALMAILGFPLILPQLVLLSDLSMPLFETMATTGWWKLFAVLGALNILIMVLSYILYPFLWRE